MLRCATPGDSIVILIQQGPLATVLDVGYGQLKRTRVASCLSCLCNNHFLFFVFVFLLHQSISDYSWEVYIVHSGVFCRMSLHA